MPTCSRSFWFHYNKPASIQAGKNQLTVHFNGACYIVDAVNIKVPCESKNRKRQPRCVMAGVCHSVEISDGVAKIW